MEITNIRNGNELKVIIDGSIDTNTAPQVEEEIMSELEGVDSLILDLKDVYYVSSSGLRLFLILYKKMSDHGTMKLINVDDFIREILDMTAFTSILDIE